jgi:hypothetical protein
VKLAERLVDLPIAGALCRQKIVRLKITEEADPPCSKLELGAKRVEKKILIGKPNGAVVIEVVVAQRRGERDAESQIVIGPIEAVRRAHRDRGGVGRDGIHPLRVGREGAAQRSRARRREHRALEKIDVALSEVGGVARGLRRRAAKEGR